MRGKLATLALCAGTLAAGSVLAQTPISAPPPRPPQAGQAAGSFNPDQAVAQTAPAMPVSQGVVDQAYQHMEGQFPVMARPSVGGQVQSAWDDAPPEAGVFLYRICPTCSYKVRVREQMVSVIELPPGEVVEAADVGDVAGFQVMVRGKNRLAVKPAGFGNDTSLLVYGRSGAVYPFYLRAESFNSVNVPDLLVRLVGEIEPTGKPAVAGMTAEGKEDGSSSAKPPLPNQIARAVEGLQKANPDVVPGDFVQAAPFDPDKLRGWGQYKLWGDDKLRPLTVFRDDYFTYVQFGDRWTDIELPTAYVVVDGIDELVNTRVQGATYIIESVQPLITLKSGETFLCIQFEGAVS